MPFSAEAGTFVRRARSLSWCWQTIVLIFLRSTLSYCQGVLWKNSVASRVLELYSSSFLCTRVKSEQQVSCLCFTTCLQYCTVRHLRRVLLFHSQVTWATKNTIELVSFDTLYLSAGQALDDARDLNTDINFWYVIWHCHFCGLFAEAVEDAKAIQVQKYFKCTGATFIA